MHHRRSVPTIKTWWLLAAFFSGFALAMWAEDMVLNWRENHLEFSAPRVHFLTDKSRDRLKNAAEVPFDLRITLFSGTRSHVYRENFARFVVSYDLWEEKYSVTRTVPSRKTAAHLTELAAEAWCLQQMPMEVNGLKGTDPLWVRLEIRAEDGKESAPLISRGNLSEAGINLKPLIELFSQPARQTQHPITVDAGPMTLDEVRRSRGS